MRSRLRADRRYRDSWIFSAGYETLNGFTAVCIEKRQKTASAAGMKAVLAESVSEEGIEQALYHM